jgi:ABC-type transport system involved in cytochrome c biogenesis permease subunit
MIQAPQASLSQEQSMRRNQATFFGLALIAFFATSLPAMAQVEKIKVEKLGTGAAYKALAKIPVEHAGRVKPLDTLAREEIKQIYGQEIFRSEGISLLNENEQFYQRWEPVAALLDWSARPEFWNKQPFIKVEYLPLKRALLHESSKTLLEEIAAKSSTSATDKDAITEVAALTDIGAPELSPLLLSKTLAADDLKAIAKLHAKLGEGHKWLSPDELEHASVMVDGRPLGFPEWIDSIAAKNREASMTSMGGEAKLTDIEEKGYEAGTAYARYKALRDREMTRFLPVLVMPRPINATYLAYTGTALQKAQESRGKGLSNFDLEAAVILNKYLENVQSKDVAAPGTNAEFDAHYTDWLRKDAAWVPLTALLEATPEQLEKAGYPVAKVESFRQAFKAFEEAEKAKPGNVDDAAANTLLAASRELGTTLNDTRYPTVAEVDREILFNSSAPFARVPYVYLTSMVLLALSLTARSSGSKLVQSILKILYVSGVSLLAIGIGVEVFGFTLRVLITGWAPVTGMYETVIYVGAVTALLGLIIELLHRKAYSALAASGVAFFTTYLAATVPLLDPTIKSLNPVLRSNYWLTIHVLTIVSSYAAFALAWGLGLLATGYYLVATYRRSASFLSLIAPIVPGLPIYFVGATILLGSYGPFTISGTTIDLGKFVIDWGFWPGLLIVLVGAVLSGGAIAAVVGEVLNRTIAKEILAAADRVMLLPRNILRNEAETRELVGAGIPPLSGGSPELDAFDPDPRGTAMHATAAVIKPISNFIYRAMQVGVLLVAAGTILGGVWADYSWGRFWGWDAKEVWALVTLLVYLVPLHGRFAGWVNTFGLVICSVVCFLSVVMAWYGVNFLLGVGLHAYGFVKGGSQGTVGMFVLCVLSLPAGAVWRRHLSQRPLPQSIA